MLDARLTKDVARSQSFYLIEFWGFGYDALTRPVAVNILNYQLLFDRRQ